MRRSILLTTVLTLSTAGLGACGNDQESSDRRVALGETVSVSTTAFKRQDVARVAVPSGVLTLGLAPDLSSAGSGSDRVTPAAGVTLAGVTWSFEPHQNSNTFDVIMNGQGRQALPTPSVKLADGDNEIDLPGDLSAPSGAVIGVGSEATSLQVEYDGFAQAVDLATGTVDAGGAEGLKDLRALETRKYVSCPSRDFPRSAVLDHGCGVEAWFRLPYIAGLGWAPSDNGWLVVDARVEGGPAKITVNDQAGKPLAHVDEGVERLAFSESGDAKTVEFAFGHKVGTVSAALPD